QLVQDLRLDHEVPGPVGLTGLEHGTGRTSGVTATLQLDAVELGLARIPVVVELLIEDDVARPVLDHLEGAGADRIEVVRALTCLLAHVVLEEVLRQNQAVATAERVEPERVRLA